MGRRRAVREDARPAGFAHRPARRSARRGSACTWRRTTPTSSNRFRELGVEQAETADELYAQADFISIHLPKTPETQGWLNAEALARCRDGVRIVNCARGELVDDDALKAALDSGKVAGAALDVFAREPVTDHPLFGYPNVVATLHLAASTTEAQDRAGIQTAEQVVAALTGGVVSTAVNIPAVSAEDMEVLAVPAARARARARGDGDRRVHRRRPRRARVPRRIAERDTRLLTLSVLNGLLAGHTDEEVNLVNAPTLAEERGIQISERRRRSRATSPTSSASPSSPAACARVWSARRSAGATGRTCWRRGAGASTSRWTRATWRCSTTRTCWA